MTKRERGWILPPAAILFAAGILLGRDAPSLLFFLFGLLFSAAAALLLRGRGFLCALLASALSLGGLCGFIAWHPVLPEAGDYQISGVVTEEIRADSLRFRTILSHVTLNGEPFARGAYWTAYTSELPEGLEPGMAVSFSGSLYHPQGTENPDGYDFRAEMLRRGVTVGVYGMTDLRIATPDFFSLSGRAAALRHTLSQQLVTALGDEAGGYASTLLLGSRSLIPSEDRAAFSRLGIAHVLSVSGFHVGILISLLIPLFRLLRMPQKIRLLLASLFLACYCALCGFAQPVIRASLLFLLAFYGKTLARPRSGLHLLSAVFMLMLLFSPVQLTGLSFQLSFGAMLGLTLISPFLRSLWDPANRFVCRLFDGVCAGIGAQLGILLPSLAAFQDLPLLSLLANLPMMFLSTALILTDWAVLLTLPVPFLSPLVCGAARTFTEGLVSVVRFLGQNPAISLWTKAPDGITAAGILLLSLGLCVLPRLKKFQRLALCCAGGLLMVLSLFPWPHTGTEYWQFSVGNADAAVLWDREKVIVIDAGYDDGVVSSFLRRRRLTPDAVILTHLHADHADGVRSLLAENIPIPLCYLPEGAESALVHPDVAALVQELKDGGTAFRTLAAGDRVPLPSGSADVLWPERGKVRPGQDANDFCLVLRLDLKGTSLLQTADLSGRYEMYAAAPADLLKIAHHGSASSTSEDFLSSVSPQAILLSTGRETRHQQVLERIGGIPLYSTALGGALTVRFFPSAFSVETFLPCTEVN